MTLYTLIYFYLFVINLLAFLLMFNDKARARNRKRRIPEKTLFTAAWLGGSLGALLGMNIFRHKTKHKSFTIGIPAILVIQLLLLSLWLYFSK